MAVEEEEKGVTQEVVESPAGIGSGDEIKSNNTVEQNAMGASSMSSPSTGAQSDAVDNARKAGAIQNETASGIGSLFSNAAKNIKNNATTSSTGIQDAAPVEQPKELPIMEMPKPIGEVEAPTFTPPPQTPQQKEQTVISDADKGKKDFSGIIADTEEQRNKSIAELEEDAAIAEQNAFNRLTHDGLAKDRNSGAYNATKMATIRRANNLVFDGKRAINAEFTQKLLDLSKDQMLADAEFNSEEYNAFNSTQQDVLSSLLDAGQIDAAVELGQSLNQTDPNGPFAAWGNPAYVEAQKAFSDVNATNNFNTNTWDPIGKLALNTTANELDVKDQIRTLLATDPVRASGRMMNFFNTLTPADKEDLELGAEDQELIDMMNKGDIDASDPAIQDIFMDAYIQDVREGQAIENRKAYFGEDYDAYKGTPVEGLLDELVESNLGQKGYFNFDNQGFNTYGQTFNAANADNAPGVDYYFQDWDGDDYIEGYTREQSLELPASEGLGDITNGEMNSMYEAYHKQKGKEFNRGTTTLEDVMNQDEFKQEAEDFMRESGGKATAGELEAHMSEVSKAATGGDLISTKEGDKSLDQLGIDVADFDEAQLENVKSLFGGESIGSIDPLELEALIVADPEILSKLVDSGDLPAYEVPGRTFSSISNDFEGDFNVIGADAPNTNNFKGAKGIELFRSLPGDGDSREGHIVIGGDLYEVVAKSGRHDKKGNASSPAIQWTVTPVTGDGDIGESVSFRGIIEDRNGNQIQTSSRGAEGFSSRILTNGFDSIDDGEWYDLEP